MTVFVCLQNNQRLYNSNTATSKAAHSELLADQHAIPMMLRNCGHTLRMECGKRQNHSSPNSRMISIIKFGGLNLIQISSLP